MSITLTCPRCNRQLSIRDESDADTVLTCPRCLGYVSNPAQIGPRRYSFDRDIRVDSRGGAGLMVVLAGLIVVGGFGFVALGLGVPLQGVIITAVVVSVPVFLGSLLLYVTGVSGFFRREMGRLGGIILLVPILGFLVFVSAFIVLLAVCFSD